jgi:hypothetical protein
MRCGGSEFRRRSRNSLVAVLIRMKRYDEAIAHLQKSLQIRSGVRTRESESHARDGERRK